MSILSPSKKLQTNQCCKALGPFLVANTSKHKILTWIQWIIEQAFKKCFEVTSEGDMIAVFASLLFSLYGPNIRQTVKEMVSLALQANLCILLLWLLCDPCPHRNKTATPCSLLTHTSNEKETFKYMLLLYARSPILALSCWQHRAFALLRSGAH